MPRKGNTETIKPMRMKTLTAIALVSAAAPLLGGCGVGNLMNRQRPDEFAVQRQAPLVIPPDFALTPPQPGAPRPAAVVGLAGPYAFDPTTWPRTAEIFTAAAGRADSARPVSFVSPKAPPMFLARGVPVENRLYPGIGHVALVLAISRPFRWRAAVLDDSVGFLEGVLKRPGATALR